MGRDRSPWLRAAVLMWENVWYVWYLGVYFPGCSWVPGVEIWLLHAGGRAPRGRGQGSIWAAGQSLQACPLTARVP